MLFIKSYDAKSLDRSSVSMIDKYNGRLSIINELLVKLSILISNLISLIADIRNTLGQCKQRVYNNLNQAKEVISGNDIAGTEGTISAIEDALKAGDVAIAQAEATLEGVQQEMECDEGTPTQQANECGEGCNETPTSAVIEDCVYCSYTNASSGGGSEWSETCSVCSHEGCNVDLDSGEEFPVSGESGCSHTSIVDGTCGELYTIDMNCSESFCVFSEGDPPSNCTFTCAHSSDCQQLPMPEDCTYTCEDHDGCGYSGDDCSYGTVCGQAEACNQIECDQYDCGEPCGETCHMTNNDGECSEGSCGEGEESDDGPCNQYDCSEYDCGEPCGESCGLL